MSDLRDAITRARSKPLREALERADTRAARRPPAPLSWQGPWSADRRYRVGDVVSHDGSSWRALREHTGSEPPSALWEYVAKKGDKGEKGESGVGITGSVGPAGPQGPPGAGGGSGNIDGGEPDSIYGGTTPVDGGAP